MAAAVALLLVQPWARVVSDRNREYMGSGKWRMSGRVHDWMSRRLLAGGGGLSFGMGNLGCAFAVVRCNLFRPCSHPAQLTSQYHELVREYMFDQRHRGLSKLIWGNVEEVALFSQPVPVSSHDFDLHELPQFDCFALADHKCSTTLLSAPVHHRVDFISK